MVIHPCHGICEKCAAAAIASQTTTSNHTSSGTDRSRLRIQWDQPLQNDLGWPVQLVPLAALESDPPRDTQFVIVCAPDGSQVMVLCSAKDGAWLTIFDGQQHIEKHGTDVAMIRNRPRWIWVNIYQIDFHESAEAADNAADQAYRVACVKMLDPTGRYDR